MKILKYILLLLLIVIIGGAIYFGTQDGKYDVAKSKVMNAPAEVVFNNVKDFRNWKDWGPWMEEDENLQISYAEKTSGEGASYSWKSEVMGDGSMNTVKVIPNKELDQKIVFNTPMGDSESDVYWRFEPGDGPGQTKVTWGMKGEHSFIAKVFMAFSPQDFDSTLGEMYDSGLVKLDSVVAKSMDAYDITVDGITTHSGGFYLFNTTSSRLDEIGAKMAPMMGVLSNFMQENNLKQSGMPFTIYEQVDEVNNTVIFSTAIPVAARVITPTGSPVLCSYMEPVTALKTTLKGKYENLSEAYTKARVYVAENNLTVDPTRKMFEVYAKDPGEYPNPADWLTEIYIPLVQSNPGSN